MTSSKRSASPEEPEGFVVGRLVGAFGLAGELKLVPVTDYPEHLARLKSVRLRQGEDEERRAVVAIRSHKTFFLMRLKGCDTVEAAQDLRGAEIWIDEDQAAPLPEGEYYVHQVVGVRVVTEDGEELGAVEEVIRTGANDVYRVGKLLIPATRDAVLRLDPPAGIIVTRPRAYLEGASAQPA